MSLEESTILSDFEGDTDLALLGGDFDDVKQPAGSVGADSDEVGTDDPGTGDDKGSADGSDSDKAADNDSTNETAGTGDSADQKLDGEDGGAKGADDKKDAHEDKDQAIPRARFNEVNRQLKEEREAREALQARIESLEKGGGDKGKEDKGQQDQVETKKEPVSDQIIFDLERQYQDAILTEDDEKAIELRAKISAETRRQAREEALQVIEARESERAKLDQAKQAQELLEKAANEVVKSYPVLDLNSENGDEAKVKEVVEWRDYLILQKGYLPHDALREASKRVLGEPENAGGSEQENKPPKDTRVESAVQRGLKESQQQPPTGEDGVGVRAAGVGAKTPESQDEYERLPKSEQKKLLQ